MKTWNYKYVLVVSKFQSTSWHFIIC